MDGVLVHRNYGEPVGSQLSCTDAPPGHGGLRGLVDEEVFAAHNLADGDLQPPVDLSDLLGGLAAPCGEALAVIDAVRQRGRRAS